MANVAIYYICEQGESSEQAVPRINKYIKLLETHHSIKGVFLDDTHESNELMELLNSPLSEIDIIFINKDIENEFDNVLINQLSRAEQFQIIYLDKI